MTDVFLTLPPLVVVFVAAVYLNTTTTVTISILLACLLWMPMARVVRGSALSLREKEYVEAARAMGASDLRIIARHILPNAIGSVAVAATVMIAGAIVLETTLSYLGFGISRYAREQDRIPSLSDVMADANVEGLFHWWGLFFPGLILVLIIMSVYFVGDGLRDALDPSDGRDAARGRRRRALKRSEPGHASWGNKGATSPAAVGRDPHSLGRRQGAWTGENLTSVTSRTARGCAQSRHACTLRASIAVTINRPWPRAASVITDRFSGRYRGSEDQGGVARPLSKRSRTKGEDDAAAWPY